MTSSAEPHFLNDFLAFTLKGGRPDARTGTTPSGVRWTWQGKGVVLLEPANDATHSVLASAGIHGDETAPIEMLTRLVADIGSGRTPLAARMLVILGNIAAMRAGDRYIDDDLNRLFSGRHASLPASHEAPRAAELESIALQFFDDADTHTKWHIDMHTAIRASVFEQFALLPHTGAPLSRAMFDWLRDARLQAVLLHREKSNTFTHFTAQRAGALACTLELGKVRPFGQNDLERFAASDAALRRLIANNEPEDQAPLRVFTVVAQIDKQSEHFVLNVAADVPNFTAFASGTELARDGEYRYRVSHDEERIVFPNPKVKPGLRAGLMVVDTTDVTLASLQ